MPTAICWKSAAAAGANGGGEVGEDAVIAALKQRMAAFKVPKKVMVIDQLPRNAMGKVRKNELRDRYKDLFQT